MRRRALTWLITAMLFCGAARGEDVVDRTWGFSYKLAGVGKAFDVSRPGVLFSGHVGARMRIEIAVHESAQPRTGEQWRDAVRAELLGELGANAKNKTKIRDVVVKTRPRAVLLYVKNHLGVFAQPHGRAFYPRNKHQCFEVHAWLDDAAPGSDKRIARALAALHLPRIEPGYGLRCVRASMKTRQPTLHPKTLLTGGLYYLVRDPIPDIAAAILRRAAKAASESKNADAKNPALTAEERWQVHFHHGRALALGQHPREAIEAYGRAARVATNPRQRRTAQYEIARCAAPIQELDQAFAALYAAFKDGMPATKGELSQDPALALCRKDPRWEKFWHARVAK